MHELSIAYSLVSTAEEAAQQAGVARVDAVHLKLGALSGVVKDALLFSYDIAANGTRLEGSELVIEDVPVVVYCDACDKASQLDTIQSFCCPTCGQPTGDIRQGRELELVSLEVIDEEDELKRDNHHETTHS